MSSSAKEIFLDAIELEGGERAAFVAKACAGQASMQERVEKLLKAHEQAETAFGKVESRLALPLPMPPAEHVEEGTLLPPYRLIKEIGSGGFGSVWLAQQEGSLRRLVALKVLKAGMDTREVVARFEAERQAVAMMDHPAIAKIFDAGSTPQGRPFFVMELVDGVPITEYCEEHHLDTQDRVRLILQVCAGLKHAHQKGVIHRDIKPSNVLVAHQEEAPLPKIIDFGIAKAVGGRLATVSIHTRVDQIVGTPGYMSPEQVDEARSVDTRSDVYSVGVLLYEMLTGHQPLDFTSQNLVRIYQRIAQEEPPKPSTRIKQETKSQPEVRQIQRRHVQGDLDWIVMRCLEKDPERRYDSMGELAADLQRYLDGEVVEAGPPTMRYRSSKFVRRNWRGLLVAGALLGVLVAGVLVSSFQARKAQRAEQEAQEKLVHANAMAGFLRDLLGGIDPVTARGRDTELIEEVLERATQKVEETSRGLPVVEADLRELIGAARYSIGQLGEARDQWKQSKALREEHLGLEDPITMQVSLDFASVLSQTGENQEAKVLLSQLVERYRSTLGPRHVDTLQVISNLAAVLGTLGELEAAEPLLREAESATIEEFGPEHESSMLARNNLAVHLTHRGKHEEAKEKLEAIVEIQLRTLTLEHPKTLASMNNLAGAYDSLGEDEKAEQLFSDVLEAKERLLPPGHPGLLIGKNNFALFLSSKGEHERAAVLREQAIASALEHHGLSNAYTLTLILGEGIGRVRMGDLKLAEDSLRKIVVEAPAVFGPGSSREWTARAYLVFALCGQGAFEEANEWLEPVLEVLEEKFNAKSESYRLVRAYHGLVLHGLGRDEEARPLMEAARAVCDERAAEGKNDRERVLILRALAEIDAE